MRHRPPKAAGNPAWVSSVCLPLCCCALPESRVCDGHSGSLLAQVCSGHVEASGAPGLCSPGPEPRTFSQAFPVLLEASPKTVLLGVCRLPTPDLPSHLGGSSQHFCSAAHLPLPCRLIQSASETGHDTYLGSPPSLAIAFYLCEHTLIIQKARKLSKTEKALSVDMGASETDSL